MYSLDVVPDAFTLFNISTVSDESSILFILSSYIFSTDFPGAILPNNTFLFFSFASIKLLVETSYSTCVVCSGASMLNSTFSAVVSPTFSTIAVNLTICLSLTSAPSGIFDVNVTFNFGPSPVDIPIIGESFVSADVPACSLLS